MNGEQKIAFSESLLYGKAKTRTIQGISTAEAAESAEGEPQRHKEHQSEVPLSLDLGHLREA